MRLHHFTSPERAVGILTDAFRTRHAPLEFDKGACFWGQGITYGNLVTTEKCELVFEWSGPIEEVEEGRNPSTMSAGTLYKTGAWRFIIVSSTNAGLMFSEYKFEDDFIMDVRKWYQKPFTSAVNAYRRLFDEKIGAHVAILE